jgi:hypothetical protein
MRFMPSAHLIYGYLGAGKTTFARQLERDIPAIRFSHDEWMVRLYGDDPPIEQFAVILENSRTGGSNLAQMPRTRSRCGFRLRFLDTTGTRRDAGENHSAWC